MELDAPIELGEAIATYQTTPSRPRFFFFFGAMLFWVQCEREDRSGTGQARTTVEQEPVHGWLAGKRSTVPLLYSVCDVWLACYTVRQLRLGQPLAFWDCRTAGACLNVSCFTFIQMYSANTAPSILSYFSRGLQRVGFHGSRPVQGSPVQHQHQKKETSNLRKGSIVDEGERGRSKNKEI